MLQLVTQGLVDPNRPVPININALLDLWRKRQDPLAVNMVKMLEQLQQAINLIWSLLQSSDEIIADNLLLTDAKGQAATTVSDLGITTSTPAPGTKVGSLTAGSLLLADANSGANSSVSLSVNTDTVDFLWVRNGGQSVRITASATGVTVDLPAGAKINIGGNQVLTDRQAATGTVSGTFGATWTATEQTIANNMVGIVNSLENRLRTMGIIS